MNKLKMKSNNLVDGNVEKIASLFPNCVTESVKEYDENGKPVLHKVVDFDLLRQELSNVLVEGRDERYRLDWAGKRQAILTANSPIAKTLRPVLEDEKNPTGADSTGNPYLSSGSVGKDGTPGKFDSENLYIEGDNLDVLKLLHETYLNKVKMIYIDPPYNTGNDFVYNDDFAVDSEEYLAMSNQTDEQGNRMTTNKETSGRYHSDWLSMMYMRLKLAKDMLTEDGFIVISIDDNELFNLKKICDDVFGEDNFINNISIKMSELSGVKMKFLKRYAKLKESALIYAKNSYSLDMKVEKKEKSAETLSGYLKYYSQVIENIDDKCEDWIITPLNKYLQNYNLLSDDEINKWKIKNSNILVYRTNSRTVDNYLKKNPNAPAITKFTNADGNEVIKWDNKEMLFLNKYIEEYIGDIWMDISTINLNKETQSIIFENGQKPLSLLKRFILSMNNFDGIVLDFFSGSATTAHAVMQLNAEDGGNRKFIMVQLPELTDEKSEAYKAGYKNICEIGKERIRRAGKSIFVDQIYHNKYGSSIPQLKDRDKPEIKSFSEEEISKVNLDIGFRVLKLADSNMKDVYYNPKEYNQSMLLGLDSSIKEDRTAEDLLFQVMLDKGVSLSSKIEKKTTANGEQSYYIVGETGFGIIDLICCLDKKVNTDAVKEIAKLQPECCVFLDSGIENDATRTNIQQLFTTYSPKTKVEVL